MGSRRNFLISKALTRILRHTASDLGLNVRSDGFFSVPAVMALRELRSLGCTRCDVEEIARDDDKQRFELRLADDGEDEAGELLIRSVQGHSMKAIEDDSLLRRLNAWDTDLPEACVHGTYFRHMSSILRDGLRPGGGQGSRKHVHFAPLEPGDGRVISGMRGDCDIAIWVDLPRALGDGIPFFLSKNQVVLSPGDLNEIVPAKYFLKAKDLRANQWIT